ncbi:hypothetical protein ACIBAG_23790 [Streptomyces sp. NPDC051243]|uniref:hypothetical protein n=1 Tax=Streptomyces sp. NPDC051243 TaxID=3365646 RepID=UPI0037ABC6AD
MTINQSGWQFHGSARVYTIAGDLHLTENSGPQEFAAVLNELRTRIQALEEIPAEELADLDAELEQAAETGPGEDDDEAEVDGDAVAGRLTRLANRLRGLSGTTNAALEASNSLEQLAQWAGAHF